jgi:SOS-response transcriptional repressor LexA
MQQVDKRAFGARVVHRREVLGMSQGELADAVGMKQQGIDNIEHGVVSRPRLLRELARALRTTDAWLLWKEGSENAAPDDLDIKQVPLVSWVSAGKLVDAESQISVEDVPLLAFADLGRGDFFALRVEGDSMDRISPEKSVIVVNRADRVLQHDKPFVFWHRTEGTTYKLWQPGPDRLEPYSWNASNKAIFIKRKTDFEVIGRVRRTLLDL